MRNSPDVCRCLLNLPFDLPFATACRKHQAVNKLILATTLGAVVLSRPADLAARSFLELL